MSVIGSVSSLPAGARGVDAFTLPPGRVIAAGGYQFASCYLANPDVAPQRPKILTPAKRDDLADAGLDLMLNWEGSPGDPLHGRTLGQWHGAYAQRLADGLEAPADVHVVISCDVNISSTNWAACDGYWEGFASECSRPLGAYVESDYLDHLDEAGLASLFWWPAAAAWSDNRVTPITHVRQQYGYVLDNTCDANVLLRRTPMWDPVAEPAAPLGSGIPVPVPEPSREVPMASHVCYASSPDGGFVEIVGCHDGNQRWRKVGEIPGGAGGFYACHPGGQGVNPVGQNELDSMGHFDADADTAWLGQHLGVTGGGSASAAQVVDELARRLANG